MSGGGFFLSRFVVVVFCIAAAAAAAAEETNPPTILPPGLNTSCDSVVYDDALLGCYRDFGGTCVSSKAACDDGHYDASGCGDTCACCRHALSPTARGKKKSRPPWPIIVAILASTNCCCLLLLACLRCKTTLAKPPEVDPLSTPDPILLATCEMTGTNVEIDHLYAGKVV